MIMNELITPAFEADTTHLPLWLIKTLMDNNEALLRSESN